ncbi:hypothetical protein HOD61_03365 [archaeon]|jgi:flagellin-like protein|nr:hypothetical protein [archaeon]
MKKKGMSPLIATILIIGFVIVLAMLIFSMTQTVFDDEMNNTQEIIDIYSIDTSFDFFCNNIIDNINSLNTTKILLVNEYAGPIDSVMVMLENGSNIKEVNLSGWETIVFNFTETYNLDVEIIPMVMVNGVLEALPWESEVKSCDEEILFAAPQCNSTTGDEDGDGYANEDDPDCYTDGIYDPELDNEGLTRSCDSCSDCQTDIENGEIGESKTIIFMEDDISLPMGCIDITLSHTQDNLTIDCIGNTIKVNNNQIVFKLGSSSNIVIQNCTISSTSLGTGITTDSATDIVVSNNRFETLQFGVVPVGGHNIIINNNNFCNGIGLGVYCTSSSVIGSGNFLGSILNCGEPEDFYNSC